MTRSAERNGAEVLDHVEALKHIRTLIDAACETDESDLLQQYLDMIKTIADKALAPRQAPASS